MYSKITEMLIIKNMFRQNLKGHRGNKKYSFFKILGKYIVKDFMILAVKFYKNTVFKMFLN